MRRQHGSLQCMKSPCVSLTRPLRRPFVWPTPLTERWNSMEMERRFYPVSCKGHPPDMLAVMMVWLRMKVNCRPAKSIGIASNERSPT